MRRAPTRRWWYALDCAKVAGRMGPRLAHLIALVALVTGGFLGAGSHAAAQSGSSKKAIEGPIALHWARLSGAEDCVSGDALARAVEAKLQRSVFPAARDAVVLIEGYVVKTPEGYRAELRMTQSDGTLIGSRTLTSAQPNCRELSETLSVVLAVMIDPDAAQRAARAPPQKRPEPRVEEASDEPRRKQSMLAYARLLIGVLPAALGLGSAYERALGRAGGLRFEASFLGTVREANPSAPIAGARDAAARIHLVYGGAAYCPLWLDTRHLRLTGCAGAEAGALQAVGLNLTQDRARRSAWIAGSASLRLALRLGSVLELHAGAAFVGAPKRSLNVQDAAGQSRTLATLGGFGAAFDLGLGARF